MSNIESTTRTRTFKGLQVCVTAAGAKIYFYVRRIDGKPSRVKLGSADVLSVADARAMALQKAVKVEEGENPQADRRARREEATLTELHAHWMIYAKAHKKSWKEDQRQFDVLLKPLASRRLSAIKRADVQALHAKLGSDRGVYCANRVLALLRAMFNVSSEIGYRGENPAVGIKKFTEVQRDRFLQAGEAKRFFAALDTESETFQDYFKLALLTGARKSNLLSMRWADVQPDRGFMANPRDQERGGGAGAVGCAGRGHPGTSPAGRGRVPLGIPRAAAGRAPDRA